jgi:RNA polymerase sigma factor (sigma-70 family)
LGSLHTYSLNEDILPVNEQLTDIVNGCVNANRESQKEFYKLYYGFSMSICLRYCDTYDDAMEVVNDGFLKIFKSVSTFNPRSNNYEASLMAWIDHYRKRKHDYLVNDIEEAHYEMSDSTESAVDMITYKEIMAVLQKLSPVYRTVFNLYVIDGYKHEEIAEQLNISVGTSKSNLSKARVNIQKMLKESNLKLYEQRRAV